MYGSSISHVEVPYCLPFIDILAIVNDSGLYWMKSMQCVKKCLELGNGCVWLDSFDNTSDIEQSFDMQYHKDYKQ